ncbi:MAG: NFACT family protein, partial [Treponema sp.]|nr:NFACT family protein [Treponema sp.]
MSLNWKEIDCILSELELPGCQIQKAVQSAFDVIALRVHGKGSTKTILISVNPGACRIHETFRAVPKTDKPLRFAEFLNSRIINSWIEEAIQLGDNRIVRITARQGEQRFKLYIRLWSNAANVIVTDETGTILDAMRRLPKRGEQTGGRYAPEVGDGAVVQTAGTGADTPAKPRREYYIREFPPEIATAAREGEALSFNEKIDAFYAEQGGQLSLESLRENVRRNWEGKIGRLTASLEKLREKEKEFDSAENLKQYGDIILANLGTMKTGDQWLEAENFYTGEKVRIRLEDRKAPSAQAEHYYEQYRKAKRGLEDVQ